MNDLFNNLTYGRERRVQIAGELEDVCDARGAGEASFVVVEGPLPLGPLWPRVVHHEHPTLYIIEYSLLTIASSRSGPAASTSKTTFC